MGGKFRIVHKLYFRSPAIPAIDQDVSIEVLKIVERTSSAAIVTVEVVLMTGTTAKAS